MNATIYEVEGGYGYSIVSEADNIHIVQEHNPSKRGYVPMTEEEASYFVDCVINGVEPTLYGDPPEPEPEPIPPSTEERLAQLENQLATKDTEIAHLRQESADTTLAILDLAEQINPPA